MRVRRLDVRQLGFGNVDTEGGHRLEALRGAGERLGGGGGIDECLEDDLDVGAREPQHASTTRGRLRMW